MRLPLLRRRRGVSWEELVRMPPDVIASHADNVIPFPQDRTVAFKRFCVATPAGLKFRAPLLGKYIVENLPVASGGGQLYVYDSGVYRNGETSLKRLIADLLGVDWTRTREGETLAWLLATADALNEQPPTNIINVRNGLLHVSKRGAVRLKPHDSKLLTPIQLPVTYDPTASCPGIDEFLSQVFPSRALLRLVEEVAGYTMVPDNSLQIAIMLRGPGGNGKSTFLNLLTSLLGSENIVHRQLQDFDEDRFAAVDLYGRLANICADLSSRELQSSSKFKEITGGDTITGERKYRDAFSFKPFARLLFSANDIPLARDGSLAFFDRWIIVPCEVRIRGTAAQDEQILQKLTTEQELSGFLNVALKGLARLRQAKRFTIPAEARAEQWRFRTHADTVAAFADAKPLKRRVWISKPDLYRTYVDWCADAKLPALNAMRFHERYPEVVSVVGKRRRGYDGFQRTG